MLLALSMLTCVQASELPCTVSANIDGNSCLVNITNSTDNILNGRLIISVYEGKRVISSKFSSITIESGENSISAALPQGAAEEADIRFFLWNSSFMPLAKVSTPSFGAALSNPPAYDASSFDNKVSNSYYNITFTGADSSELNTFIRAITSVTAGGYVHENRPIGYTFPDTYHQYVNTDYQYQYGYSGYDSNGNYSYDSIKITSAAIADYGASTDIVISADGYKDLVITVDNTNKTVPQPPAVSDYEEYSPSDNDYYTKSDYYRISFSGFDSSSLSSYLNGITSVVADDVNTYEKYSWTFYGNNYRVTTDNDYNYVLDIGTSYISQSGKTNIKISSAGYADLIFTIDNAGAALKASPSASYELYYSSPDYYRISFDISDESELSSYIKKINSVNIDGTEFTSSSYLSTYYSDRYKLYSESGVYKYLDITATDISTNGKTSITVSAKGYEPLTFVIDNTGGIPTKTPPEVSSLVYTEPSWSYYGSFYRMSFYSDSSVLDSYFGRITSVTVNGVTYGSTYSIYSDTEKSYKTVSENGSYKYIDFTTDCVSNGKATIIIKATGYDDIEYDFQAN